MGSILLEICGGVEPAVVLLGEGELRFRSAGDGEAGFGDVDRFRLS